MISGVLGDGGTGWVSGSAGWWPGVGRGVVCVFLRWSVGGAPVGNFVFRAFSGLVGGSKGRFWILRTEIQRWVKFQPRGVVLRLFEVGSKFGSTRRNDEKTTHKGTPEPPAGFFFLLLPKMGKIPEKIIKKMSGVGRVSQTSRI